MSHPSARAIYLALRKYVCINELHLKAQRLINLCKKCQSFKHYKTNKHAAKAIKTPETPFSSIATDIYGPISIAKSREVGYKKVYILTFIDLCTRWAEAFCVKNIKAYSVVKTLEKWIKKHQSPDCITSDNGRQFRSRKLEEYLKNLEIKHIFTTLYKPRANGTCERINQVIGRIIRCNRKCNFNEIVSKINHSLQHRVNRVTEHSPNEIVMENSLFDPLNRVPKVDVQQIVHSSNFNKSIQWHNNRHPKRQIRPGTKGYRDKRTHRTEMKKR